MGITTSISISDADDSIGGTQIYPGYTSTITVAATVNDLTDDSRLSNPTISNEKLRLYDINGNLIATIDLVLTWTLVSSGDSNSNGFWDLGETLTWTASYTIPADLFTTYSDAVSARISATVGAVDQDGDPESGSPSLTGIVLTEPPPPPPEPELEFEGLSQGYWGQHIPGVTNGKGNKTDGNAKGDATWDMTAYDGTSYKNASFEIFFGIDSDWGSKVQGKKVINTTDIKFTEAINIGGDGQYALARDAVAAVLNAERFAKDDDGAVEAGYVLTVAQIKTAVQAAFGGVDLSIDLDLIPEELAAYADILTGTTLDAPKAEKIDALQKFLNYYNNLGDVYVDAPPPSAGGRIFVTGVDDPAPGRYYLDNGDGVFNAGEDSLLAIEDDGTFANIDYTSGAWKVEFLADVGQSSGKFWDGNDFKSLNLSGFGDDDAITIDLSNAGGLAAAKSATYGYIDRDGNGTGFVGRSDLSGTPKTATKLLAGLSTSGLAAGRFNVSSKSPSFTTNYNARPTILAAWGSDTTIDSSQITVIWPSISLPG